MTVQVKGVIFGHFDKGKMTIVGDYKPDVPGTLNTVSSAKMDIKGAKSNVVYSGNDVRFLFPSGAVTLKFEGSGIDLSAVGKGTLKVTGKTSVDDGTVAVNGQKATPLPAVVAFGGTSLTVTATVEKTQLERHDLEFDARAAATSVGRRSDDPRRRGRELDRVLRLALPQERGLRGQDGGDRLRRACRRRRRTSRR